VGRSEALGTPTQRRSYRLTIDEATAGKSGKYAGRLQ
jgi:hypothetical protein